ncbi:16S rRNA (cytosine(1402)-N(4))-methyltransferase RsmH [Clostridium sp. 'deep sea']|uniref:16S rRNA (cytosine(1402)-N(4))-methyltransferase RsmH n=1 Tax=Clostridium sp. 'deep sea' TaxID=2779445 RepID=UPI00189668B4|nr:16S rRNA (cytosine(1402)-N(4))-methyltransferase RsmH [Clostridium sp. 'deep sea']QOR36225.1 16S rRNA (cytosine(1402)-N(4))-methyltransferase RsmH [Clostridium sp. 'deep sea']
MSEHISVLLYESIEKLNIKADGIYVDATLGRGGHSKLILEKLSTDGRLICFDQDQAAIDIAEELWHEDPRVTVVHSNFANLEQELLLIGVSKIDGILFDLGVSSPQLDQAERGFSYLHSGVLDMRMDQRQKLTAYDVVNSYPEKDIRDCLYKYGEEKKAAKIAKLICITREQQPIETTYQLAELIKRAFSPKERQAGHPARRSFQALRILVNHELEVLEQVLPQAINLLKKNGVICVITFHSLEDRIVKNIFKNFSGKCTCPPGLPICTCGNTATIEVKKPLIPKNNEVNANLRARSARLRYARKL